MEFIRDIAENVQYGATHYPVVTLIGPRQSGKTTLAKQLFGKKTYANLEEPDIRQQALADPRGFLSQFPDGAIIDEIQHAPELLSYIQAIVDEKKHNGLFVITGSQQLSLNEAITQSLAGRTDIIKLLPLSITEVKQHLPSQQAENYLFNGFYPSVYSRNIEPVRFYRNYLETYVQRDVRQLLAVKDLNKFMLFIKLCAGRIGQLFNASQLANAVGVSSHTIDEWLSVLETSFILFRLPPYYNNIKKRLIKSPKIYFYDTGLACYLLDIQTPTQVARDPLYGQLFENLVLLELMKTQYNKGIDHPLYFYRDSSQHEVDVIFKRGSELSAIEIKAAKTFHPQFVQQLDYLQKLFPEQLTKRYVIYNGDIESQFHNTEIHGLNSTWQPLIE